MTTEITGKPLRIACVAIGEMGHFIPMSQIVDALIKRGHDVYFITANDAYNGHKSSKIMTSIGCKNQIFTDDGMTQEEFWKKPKHIKNDNHHHQFFDKFRGLVKKEIEKIMPDLIVCDFYTRVGAEIADQLKIPTVLNVPGMVDMCHKIGMSGVFDMNNAKSYCG